MEFDSQSYISNTLSMEAFLLNLQQSYHEKALKYLRTNFCYLEAIEPSDNYFLFAFGYALFYNKHLISSNNDLEALMSRLKRYKDNGSIDKIHAEPFYKAIETEINSYSSYSREEGVRGFVSTLNSVHEIRRALIKFIKVEFESYLERKPGDSFGKTMKKAEPFLKSIGIGTEQMLNLEQVDVPEVILAEAQILSEIYKYNVNIFSLSNKCDLLKMSFSPSGKTPPENELNFLNQGSKLYLLTQKSHKYADLILNKYQLEHKEEDEFMDETINYLDFGNKSYLEEAMAKQGGEKIGGGDIPVEDLFQDLMDCFTDYFAKYANSTDVSKLMEADMKLLKMTKKLKAETLSILNEVSKEENPLLDYINPINKGLKKIVESLSKKQDNVLGKKKICMSCGGMISENASRVVSCPDCYNPVCMSCIDRKITENQGSLSRIEYKVKEEEGLKVLSDCCNKNVFDIHDFRKIKISINSNDNAEQSKSQEVSSKKTSKSKKCSVCNGKHIVNLSCGHQECSYCLQSRAKILTRNSVINHISRIKCLSCHKKVKSEELEQAFGENDWQTLEEASRRWKCDKCDDLSKIKECYWLTLCNHKICTDCTEKRKNRIEEQKCPKCRNIIHPEEQKVILEDLKEEEDDEEEEEEQESEKEEEIRVSKNKTKTPEKAKKSKTPEKEKKVPEKTKKNSNHKVNHKDSDEEETDIISKYWD